MRRYIRDLVDFAIFCVALLWHLSGATARYARGGLFVFRDTPTWVLREMVLHTRRKKLRGTPVDPDIEGLLLQAADEFRFRRRKAWDLNGSTPK